MVFLVEKKQDQEETKKRPRRDQGETRRNITEQKYGSTEIKINYFCFGRQKGEIK
jgi:hypothetical protein